MLYMPAHMVSHGQNSHVAPYFDCPDLRNMVVLLTTLWASCETTTSVSGLNGQKSDVAPHFSVLDLRNAMALSMTPLASDDTDANTIGIT